MIQTQISLTVSRMRTSDEMFTLSDIIITEYIVTDTSFHGHNYSRSTVSGKFLIFRIVSTKFRHKEKLKHR